jgi:predicted Zn-dependent protease
VLLDSAEVDEKLPGGFAQAVENYRRALNLLAPLRTSDPNNLRNHSMAADIGLRLAHALTRSGDGRGAAQAAMASLEISKNLAERPAAAPWQFGDYADALLHADPAAVRNPAIAAKYAQLAVDATHGRDPRFLELLAEGEFGSGHPQEAATNQQKALDLATDAEDKTRMADRLKKYRAAGGRK